MSIKSNKKSSGPGFKFEWDSKAKNKAKATVFAKRKRKSSESPSKLTISKPHSSTSILDDAKASTSNTFESSLESTVEARESAPTGYIKRKQQKDKLLSKKLLQDDEKSVPRDEKANYSLFNVKHKDIYVKTIVGKSVSEKVFSTCPFNDMGIHPHLLSNLEKHGFLKSTNVQSKAIPVIMSGKNTLVKSQTGSGKTLAYAVPIIDALQGIQPRLKRTDGIQAIIVVPTRELTLQVHELFSKINTFQWLVVGHLCGGESRKTEKDRIKKGMSVVIGTPGRLLDHVVHTAAMKIDQVRCLVLDEADLLLDMGFRRDIVSLVEALDESKLKSKRSVDEETVTDSAAPLKHVGSKKRQNVMLSATLTKAVSELASFTMLEHTYIDALDLVSSIVANSYVIPDTVRQEFIVTHAKHRLFMLAALLAAHARRRAGCKLFVFMASTQMVDFHYELFSKHLVRMPVRRIRAADDEEEKEEEEDDGEDDAERLLDIELFKLHGSMDQQKRKAVFKGFRAAQKGILFCTDVVARGIDVPTADGIIQYTGPQTDADYLHRVGRTGRAGQAGSALIFLTHEEQAYVEHLRAHRVLYVIPAFGS